MGIFSEVTDSLFGGGGDAAKDQAKANKESQKYTKEQAEQARSDAYRLFTKGSQPLAQGYQGAIDALGGTLRQQIDTTARGNYFGQEALLSSMPQFQNAILGYGVDNTKMAPRILHPERNLEWMFNQQLGARSGGHDPLQGLDPEVLKQMAATGLTPDQWWNMAYDAQYPKGPPGTLTPEVLGGKK